MRIIFYLILVTLLFSVFLSCSKGDILKDPQFGGISITNFAPEGVTIVQGEDREFQPNGVQVNLVSGKNRFRFYYSNKLLLDTLLSVEPFTSHNYVMFMPAANADIKIFDSGLNGLDKEALPDSGKVKISMANFAASLPGKVNVTLSTTTYILNVPQEIQVARFLNVTSSFSAFEKIVLGRAQLPRPQNVFIITAKDPVSDKVLATTSITLPNVASTGELIQSVYLLYLDANSSAGILMSK